MVVYAIQDTYMHGKILMYHKIINVLFILFCHRGNIGDILNCFCSLSNICITRRSFHITLYFFYLSMLTFLCIDNTCLCMDLLISCQCYNEHHGYLV